ncbi:MAG TPA: GNAT family N-acetyltransferase [Chloroflexia bacterium]|jgi:predicted acetyltransferase|nr:GNAT family N-acetyltransferase [Chloroflexia bacterium]
MAAFLTRPSVEYRDSYLRSVRETQTTRSVAAWELAALNADFAGFVRDLLERGDPAQAVPGRMPEMIYWLIDDGEYIGRVSIRHAVNDWVRTIGGHIGYEIRPSRRRRGYGTLILRLALPHAREMGITRVLITCDEDNIGSKKIIEANGGRFESAVTAPGQRSRKLRYWIDLAPPAAASSAAYGEEC